MNTAVAKKPLRQVADVKQLLHNDQAREQLSAVAAKHMSPARLMRVTANAIRTTPKLQEAEPLSFLGALMQCAALGLEPNSVLGHAYLVPFKNNRKGVTEVQVILGYKGYKALAWRSGQISSIHADVVYSDDADWSFAYGTDTHLRHQPGPRNGEKTHAYCHVSLSEGGQAFVVLPWEEVIRIRDASQNWQTAVRYGKTKDSPWFTHEDVMAAKTAVRYLFQRGDVPVSIEMADAMAIDHEESGARVDYTSFAQNPADGPAIEGEFTEDAPAAADSEAQSAPADGDSNGEPEAAAPAPEPQAQPAQAAPDAAEAAPNEIDAAAEHRKTRDNIMSDLADGAPVDATKSFYGEALAKMEREAPDFHKALMADMDDYAPEKAE